MTVKFHTSTFILDSPSRLAPGTVMLVFLEQEVEQSGIRSPGPHLCGKAEVLADGRLSVGLLEATKAGSTARGLLEIDALDVVVEGSAIRLRA